MRPSTILLSATLAIGCSTLCAAAEPAACPDTIAVRQELAAAVEGWTPTLDDTPHRLAGITFYDGPPQERASLVSDRTTKAAGKETAVWHFKPQANRQIFVACSYATTAIILTKPLPPKTASCSVTYSLQTRVAGLPVIEKIACK